MFTREIRYSLIECHMSITAFKERSDVCAVPAAAVVAESMVALVLAQAETEKFGGDSVAEVRRNLAGYLENLVIQ